MALAEEGSKPSCALPYELAVQGRVVSRDAFEIEMSAGQGLFGKDAAGAPFTLYLHGVREGFALHDIPGVPNSVATAHYAVRAGDTLRDRSALSRFATDVYDFFRQFKGQGSARCPLIACTPRIGAKGARQAGLPDFLQRYAGRVETGASSISDPLMGRAR